MYYTALNSTQNLLWLVEDHSLKPSPGKSVRLSRNSKCSKKHWGVTSSGRALARVQPPVLPKKKKIRSKII
jgi:hypothetical protein